MKGIEKKEKCRFITAVKWLVIGYSIGITVAPILSYFERYKERVAREASLNADSIKKSKQGEKETPENISI